MRTLILWFTLLALAWSTCTPGQAAIATPSPAALTLPPPPPGRLYHAVYPGGITGEESDLTLDDLRSYEAAAGKSAVWVYFSHNWYEGRGFPLATATWIRDAGSIPYIRLMLRSSWEQGVAEPLYSLQNIIDGQFDPELQAWCAAARDFGTPLLAEYGTEVNGQWFSWNGAWNGAGQTDGYGDPNQPDGPERFRDAYRHIIQTCRDAGAENLTWVFHLNAGDWPEEAWNAFENYYPGDEWIDWIGVSSYGAQTPQDDDCDPFRDSLDAVYPRLDALAADKPIFIAEFGAAKNNPLCDQAEWARAALTDLTSFRWPRIMGFSWWNEWWQNDDNPAHDTTMRLQDNPELAAVFQELAGNNPNVLGAPALFQTYLPLVTNTPALQTVIFTPSSADIPNPERGFHQGFGMDETSLDWYTAQGYRLAYTDAGKLDAYRDRDLPPREAYLNALPPHFQLARDAGIKLIVRFSYNDGPANPNPGPDASLAQVLRHIEQLAPVLEANKDGWINIPAEANDAYVNSLIDLIKNGGNGFAPLETERKLYIEYSNEVWNGMFDQAQFNYDQAVAEVNAGNSPLNFDGETNDWYWGWRRVGKRIVEISQQFRAAFGDAQMMTRFRPVLAWQIGNGQATASQQLYFIDRYYGTNEWGYADPHPVDYYLWGGGGALYYDDILLAQDNDFKNAVQTDSQYASAYGIHYVNYEGGMTFDGANDPERFAAWVTQDMIDRQQYYEEHGGALWMYFTLASDDAEGLGFLQTIRDLNKPKYNAILQLAGQASAWQNTFGASLPMRKDGKDFSLIGGDWEDPGTGATTLSPNAMRAYHYDADVTGVYKVWGEYSSSAAIDLNIYAGSELVGTITANTNGNPTTSAEYLFNSTDGLKAIRIENLGNAEFSLITVNVELVQAAPPAYNLFLPLILR